MELDPPHNPLTIPGTSRLIRSRYPTIGIFDAVATPEDLIHLFDLEGWTNDRLQAELGQLHFIPQADWVLGATNASIVMASFCHPRPEGSRFTGPNLGAWYAALALETAHREGIHHVGPELREIGAYDLEIHVRQYLADFDATFHDVRDTAGFATLYDPDSYAVSQPFGVRLRDAGSDGIVYKSVRDPGGDCVVAFKPRLVSNVRQGSHFRYVWAGDPAPSITRLTDV